MSIAARGDDESAKVNLMHNCIVVIYMQQADRFLSCSSFYFGQFKNLRSVHWIKYSTWFNFSVNLWKFCGILAILLHYCQSATFVGHFAREVKKFWDNSLYLENFQILRQSHKSFFSHCTFIEMNLHMISYTLSVAWTRRRDSSVHNKHLALYWMINCWLT